MTARVLAPSSNAHDSGSVMVGHGSSAAAGQPSMRRFDPYSVREAPTWLAFVLVTEALIVLSHSVLLMLLWRYRLFACGAWLAGMAASPLPPACTPRHPEQDNGGTILAVSSNDFVIVASDTRQSEGYSIQSRYTPRLFPLTQTTVIAVQGFQGDADTFVKRLRQRLEVSLPAVQHGTRQIDS